MTAPPEAAAMSAARDAFSAWAKQHYIAGHETWENFRDGFLAAATPRCPTLCDPDCEAPCHEAHQLPGERGHEPSACRGALVAAAVAAERDRLVRELHCAADEAAAMVSPGLNRLERRAYAAGMRRVTGLLEHGDQSAEMAQ